MYSFKSRVRYSELAADKRLSLVSIVNYFQDCCTFEAEDKEVGLQWLSEHHTSWMLTNWQIHILRRPEYCEDIEIITWASGFKYFIGKRSFLIRSVSGEPLIYALSDWAYVNVVENRPEKNVPAKELEAYGLDVPIERRFSEFDIPVSEEEQILKGKIDVEFMKGIGILGKKADGNSSNTESIAESGNVWFPHSIVVSGEHLDTNNHVNNAQYVAIATAQLPADFRTSVFRAEYKMQSKLGDVIYPVIETTDEGYIVVLNDEAGEAKLVCEFIR
jgi:acyl-ACP thioesterase